MTLQAEGNGFAGHAAEESEEGWRLELPTGEVVPVTVAVVEHTIRGRAAHIAVHMPPTVTASVALASGFVLRGEDSSVRWALAKLVRDAADKSWRVWLLAPGELSRAELSRVLALPAPPPVALSAVLSAEHIEALRRATGTDATLGEAIDRLTAAFASESAARRSYEEGITWETTCRGCARLLTQLVELEHRAGVRGDGSVVEEGGVEGGV